MTVECGARRRQYTSYLANLSLLSDCSSNVSVTGSRDGQIPEKDRMQKVYRYTRTAIALHWLTALLVVVGFVIGLIMTDIPGLTMMKLKYFSWHKWIGISVFLLMITRLCWRMQHPAPVLPAVVPVWQVRASNWMHAILYGLLFVIPLSGYFYSLAAGVQVVYFGVLPLPVLIAKNDALKQILVQVHAVLNYTLAALVAVHVVAALKHQFIDRDGVLARMLPLFNRSR
jgi:cytochrome b561